MAFRWHGSEDIRSGVYALARPHLWRGGVQWRAWVRRIRDGSFVACDRNGGSITTTYHRTFYGARTALERRLRR